MLLLFVAAVVATVLAVLAVLAGVAAIDGLLSLLEASIVVINDFGGGCCFTWPWLL